MIRDKAAPSPAPGKVIVLTGPPGAGKSTVARLLADALSPSVHLHSDDFWHFIRQGAIAPYLPEAHQQNQVVIAVVAQAAFGYATGGYDVICDGIIGPWFLDAFRTASTSTGIGLHYVVLRPDELTTLNRATARGADALTDPEPVRSLHQQFTRLGALEPHALDVLNLAPDVFGLTDAGASVGSSECSGPRVGRVTIPLPEEDDSVRRRAFLLATGSVVAVNAAGMWPTGTVAGGLDPAALLSSQLGDVLLSPTRVADIVPVGRLRQALATARQEFATCQYVALAGHLPALLDAAEATAADQSDPAVQLVLADAYNLATRALIKLEASGLEWLSADRGLLAARAAGDPLVLAEAQRLVASVARRAGHHDRARSLTLAAASHLRVSGARPAPEHLAMYGMLHCSAGYAAARAGDRDRANDLLAEAAVTADRLSADPDRQRALAANVVSHRVSAAYLLGDAGAALAHAQSLPLTAIPTTERRARLLVDTAQAWARFDRPDRAYRTLLVAERTAPGEVRTRNAVRRLVTELMASPKQAAMPGLPGLAHRVHAA